MGEQVLANDGQGGRVFLWSQLERPSLFVAGREPRALPGAETMAVSLLFFFPLQGQRNQPPLRMGAVQPWAARASLTPRAPSTAFTTGELPSAAQRGTASLMACASPSSAPPHLSPPPATSPSLHHCTLDFVPCLGLALALPRPGPKATQSPQLV